MLVNRYMLRNVITGKVILGTRNELEEKGFDGNTVCDAMHKNYLIYGEWECSLLEKVRKQKKEQKKESNRLSIDEVQKLATEAGMHYGEYVALHNL